MPEKAFGAEGCAQLTSRGPQTRSMDIQDLGGAPDPLSLNMSSNKMPRRLQPWFKKEEPWPRPQGLVPTMGSGMGGKSSRTLEEMDADRGAGEETWSRKLEQG